MTTKIGHLFVLDRETGKTLVPVEERATPRSDVAGEAASPTQPFPAWQAMTPPERAAAASLTTVPRSPSLLGCLPCARSSRCCWR